MVCYPEKRVREAGCSQIICSVGTSNMARPFEMLWQVVGVMASGNRATVQDLISKGVLEHTSQDEYRAVLVFDVRGAPVKSTNVDRRFDLVFHVYVSRKYDSVMMFMSGPVEWYKHWTMSDSDQARRELMVKLATPTSKEKLFNAAQAKARLLKVPTKRESMLRATQWVQPGYYEKVCDDMRGVQSQTLAVQKVIIAIQTYMKHSALVAPAVPKGVEVPTPLVLWRGVSSDDEFKPNIQYKRGATVSSNGGCFTTFSYDRRMAENFGPVLLRLQVDRIGRGTPWVWFTDDEVSGLPQRWRNALSGFDEGEIMLPPGYFKILSVQPTPRVTIFDVAFMPRPQYVRRGMVGRLEANGKTVVKTIGGHRLVMNSPAAAANVQARRQRLAAASTTRVAAKRVAPVSANRVAAKRTRLTRSGG